MTERGDARRALKAALRDLYDAAGRPDQTALRAEAARAGHRFTTSTVSEWLNGNRAPRKLDASVIWLIEALQRGAAARGKRTPPLRHFQVLHLRMSGTEAPPGVIPSPNQARRQLRLEIAEWLDRYVEHHYAKLARLPYLSTHARVETLDVEQRVRAYTRDPDIRARFRDPELETGTHCDVRFDELVRVCPRVVLLGDPGSGKTWTLRMTALRLAHQARQLALDPAHDLDGLIIGFWVRGDDLARGRRDAGATPDALCIGAIEEALKHTPAIDSVKRWLTTHCRAHPTIYMLDAFEHIAERDRVDVVETLDAAPLQAARIIVSSRISGYSRAVFLPGDSVESAILPFGTAQITAYVNAWELPENGRAELVDRLSRPSVARMAHTPLLLAFLCHLASANQALPETRAELYGRLVRRFLRGEHLDAAFGQDEVMLHDPVTRERELRRTLRLLAFTIATNPHGWEDEVPSIRLEEYLAGIARPDNLSPAETLSLLADRVGVLVPDADPRDGRDPSYSFIHRTFAEYLCAEYLASTRDMLRRALQNHVHLSPEWHETWLLAASYDPAAILAALIDIDPDPLYTALGIGAEAIGEMTAAQRAVVHKEMDWISSQSAALVESQTAYRAIRIIGIKNLGHLGPDHAVHTLGRLVSDPNAGTQIRVAAAESLAKLGTVAAVPYLRSSLLNSGGSAVDSAIEQALGELDLPEAADALIDAINDSYWYEVQLDSADTLWRSKQFPAIVEEWRTLSPEVDPERHSRLTTAIAVIERHWGDVQGCIDFQRRKVIDAGVSTSYMPRFDAPQRESGDQTQAAQSAIALLTQNAPRFDGTVGYDEDDVFEMPAPPGFPGAEPTTYNLVLRPDTGGLERVEAAELLARTGEDGACDALMYALGDEDESVRAAAATGLAQLRCVSAVSALLAALFREIDAITRSSMIEAVTLLDIDAVVETLKLPFDHDDDVAREAVFGLAFEGLKDRPVPVDSRRVVLSALAEITARATGSG